MDSPQLGHALQELSAAELALRRRSELPGHDQNAHADRIQHQVVTEPLDPVQADLILIMWICRPHMIAYLYHVLAVCTLLSIAGKLWEILLPVLLHLAAI